jgi:hypothetical protein
VLPFFGFLELKHTEMKARKLERSGREILTKKKSAYEKEKRKMQRTLEKMKVLNEIKILKK